MKQAIETRELITLRSLGAMVRGTYHRPAGNRFTSEPDRVGVLIVNSLSPTRAAAGDSAVEWADSFARAGYPSFRVDQPGFGDSDGNPPPELLKFINTGGFASIGVAMIGELCANFQLSGVVVVGLCAGAVSAIYAAGASKECRGLVLMDPYFHLPLPPTPWLWQKLTGRISRTGAGLWLSGAYDRAHEWARSLRRNPLPVNANLHLLHCWKSVATAGLPILLLKASAIKPRGEDFDYQAHIVKQAGPHSRVVVEVIDGAGHTFSSRIGRAAVREQTERWLREFFPLPAIDQPVEVVKAMAVQQEPHYSVPSNILQQSFIAREG